MKANIKKLKIVAIMTVLISIPLIGCEDTNDNMEEKTSSELDSDQKSIADSVLIKQISSMPKEDLSQAEIDGLIYLREEEKLARDVYLTLYETSPLRPFENISKSEQQHMNAVKYLLSRYDIEDPAEEAEIGVFKNSELQDLFNTLIVTGKKGDIEALKVGALIEEKDIFDLDQELRNNVDNQDITFVYGNLLRGSKNHLRAFTRVLGFRGVDYAPVILEQNYFEEIINN